MGKDCNCHEKSDHDHKRKCCKPVLQAWTEFTPQSTGQIISGPFETTVVKFDKFPVQKCVDYQQESVGNGGTVFTVRKSGIYNVQFGGIIVLVGSDTMGLFSWAGAGGIVVNEFNNGTPNLKNIPQSFFSFVVLAKPTDVDQGGDFLGLNSVTQTRSNLIKLEKGDKVRFIAFGEASNSNVNFTVNIIDPSLSLQYVGSY